MADLSGTTPPLSRRRFLRSAAAATGVAVVGGVGALVGFEAAGAEHSANLPTTGASSPPTQAGAAGGLVPFRDVHQAGIVTPAQDRLAFAAFDVVTTSASVGLVAMLKEWTVAAELMTRGEPVGTPEGGQLAPPTTPARRSGLQPGRLTITIGFGPGLFDDRFGIAAARPSALSRLPRFAGDFLEPERSDGDIAIQACADDPQLAFHAVRNLARLGRGTVVMRWFQLGFGRTSSTSSSQMTARNLLGFKDGTNNIVAEDSDLMRDHVWVGPETDQPWMRDGVVPRDPSDPDAHRVLGPDLAGRAGAGHRPEQDEWRTARWDQRARRGRSVRGRCRWRSGHRRRGSHPASGGIGRW